MYLDVFTLSALVDELLDTLIGGRVQDVLDTDAAGLGLEIYAGHRRRYLYLSADPQTPRVHLVEDRLRRGLTRPTNLGLLFRRYVEGGIVEHVSQPPWERVLQLDIAGPEGPVSVIIEPMERRSNLLLVQDGIILDCMRRVGPDENRYRVSLPAQPYVPPPPQAGKLRPDVVGAAELQAILESSADPKRKAYQALAGCILGFSPLLAREVIYRAAGSSDAPPSAVEAQALYAAFRALIDPLLRRQWQAGIAGDAARPEAFSVYPLLSLDGWHRVSSVSEAISRYFGAPVGEEAYTAAKAPVRQALQEAVTRLSAKLISLERSVTDEAERERLRQSGELILAYQYVLTPGQTELRAQYDPEGPELVIKLDPTLSPLDNARQYFSRYDKAKRALEDVPALIEATRTELAFLEQLAIDLDLATSWPDIDEVQQALQARGHWKGKPARRAGGSGQSAPQKLVTPEGFVIWLGRNSRQNEQVTFGKGSGQDYWLHARGVPGAHVIIKHDGRPVPAAVIEAAAGLAAYYSARRHEAKAPVDVTRCAYVRRIKGAGPGMVTYRNEETWLVKPRASLEDDHT